MIFFSGRGAVWISDALRFPSLAASQTPVSEGIVEELRAKVLLLAARLSAIGGWVAVPCANSREGRGAANNAGKHYWLTRAVTVQGFETLR